MGFCPQGIQNSAGFSLLRVVSLKQVDRAPVLRKKEAPGCRGQEQAGGDGEIPGQMSGPLGRSEGVEHRRPGLR